MITFGITPEQVIENSPRWFRKLMAERTVFGRRKDKLIRDICQLGGMSLLERDCGFSFKKGSSVTRIKVSYKQLAKLKRELLEEQALAITMLKARRIVALSPGHTGQKSEVERGWRLFAVPRKNMNEPPNEHG